MKEYRLTLQQDGEFAPRILHAHMRAYGTSNVAVVGAVVVEWNELDTDHFELEDLMQVR